MIGIQWFEISCDVIYQYTYWQVMLPAITTTNFFTNKFNLPYFLIIYLLFYVIKYLAD